MSHHSSRPPTEARDSSTLPQRPPPGSPARGPGRFPPRWNLYQPSGWTRKFKIGECQDAPLFAVVPHSGWFGRPRLTLHAGSGAKSAVVAAVRKTSSSFVRGNRHGFEIVFPSAPGEDREGEGMPENVVEVEAHLSVDSLLRHRRYRFTVKAGRGWERRAETFEWRYTHGGRAVGVLREGKGEGKFRKALGRLEGGWELVRLDSAVGLRPGWSGGEEIVAVWGEPAMGMHKKASFAFVGSGAMGSLGERFANMAAISAMALWDEEQRQRRRRQASVAAT